MTDAEAVLVRALYAAFGNGKITTKVIRARIVGLALREPVNVALLQALEAIHGRDPTGLQIGLALGKVTGQQVGDLKLVYDLKPLPNQLRRWRIDRLRECPCPPPPESRHSGSLGEIVEADEVSARREERLARAAYQGESMAKLKADPEAVDTFLKVVGRTRLEGATRVKPVRVTKKRIDPGTGQQVTEEWLADPETGKRVASEATAVAAEAPTEVQPPKPLAPPPKVWKQPTRAELAARHEYCQLVGLNSGDNNGFGSGPSITPIHNGIDI